jgi:hypothetical protein
MKIQVDQEGMIAVSQLCDIALKVAGLKNLDSINVILRSILILPVAPNIGGTFPNPEKSQEILKDVQEEEGQNPSKEELAKSETEETESKTEEK